MSFALRLKEENMPHNHNCDSYHSCYIICPKELYKKEYSHTCDPVIPVVLKSVPEPDTIILIAVALIIGGLWYLVKSKTT